MIGRLKNFLGRLRAAAPAAVAETTPPPPPPPTFAEEVSAQGRTVAEFVRHRRSQPGTLYSSLTDDAIRALAARSSEAVTATVAAADRVLGHQFDLLGSGPYVPRDPVRTREGYQPVDWYLDPIQNLRFPERVPHKSWNLLEMRPGLADVKLPWEIGRCQHWLTLAQAFVVTGDERYAAEILDQHDDFMEANPVGLGVQWTCTMDVAIRALNWAMAIELIHSRTNAPAERIERVYQSLFDHGLFIEGNLENKYEVTSNHFLSNVVGLFGLAALFRGLPSAARWRASCRGWLEQEMRVQVLPDGADYESSVPYHRLVAELFMSAARTAETSGEPLSAEYHAQLRKMIEFLDAVLRPDGRVPQIGDADDGRVHVFSDYGHWQPQDARHLFAPASMMFDTPEWWRGDDPWAVWEAAFWGYEAGERRAVERPPVAHLFADAGIGVVKRDALYLLVTNGIVGTNGFGNHKHNDLLSFEFHDRGHALIVDPGSYVYTSDPDSRNRFRSTAAHNTLAIDGVEQNEFKPEWLFRMFAAAVPEHLEWTATESGVTYHGRHNGYERLENPVTHARAFLLDYASGRLQLRDEIGGSGTHDLQWRFQFAPGVSATREGASLLLTAGGHRWRLRCDLDTDMSLESSWYSPSYGVRHQAPALSIAKRVVLAKPLAVSFSVERA